MADNESDAEENETEETQAADDEEYGQNQYGGDESVDAVEQTERVDEDDDGA